ncbi:hypothetical protein B0H10DRAFT_2445673 [Mycena sp. CBHHK59/15]|nr:hypothetical protein B0H10DRAFT_2445673 [Mycena sp. CBHHK59/15]
MSNTLWAYFHKGEKQNSTHYKTYCKSCVAHQMESVGAPMSDIMTHGQTFRDACTVVGHTLSTKQAWIAHLLGGSIPCAYASTEAKADATAQRAEINNTKKRVHPEAPEQAAPSAPAAKKRQAAQSTLTAMSFRRNDMPYGEAEADAFQKQALRAIISGGLPLSAFEDHEMKVLFGMMRTTAPAFMPSGKVAGGRLLNAAANRVDAVLFVRLKGRLVGLSTDGWKCKKKNAVNAICANVDFQFNTFKTEILSLTPSKLKYAH